MVDTLTLHPAASLVRLVANHEGMAEDLGKQDTRGMLQSMATRAAFLSDPPQTMVFHDTPQHAAWMNQLAMWCSMLVRKVLTRASCTSGED